MKIVNDDSRVFTKLETSLTDDARVVIYDRNMFIAQATARVFVHGNYFQASQTFANKAKAIEYNTVLLG